MADYQLEAPFAQKGAVIGVDEAGRGPWAGPVTAAAFWINPVQLDALPSKLTDSKKLTASLRQTIRAQLEDASPSHLFSICHSNSQMIDEIGILNACFDAMARAVSTLGRHLESKGVTISQVIVDGNILPSLPFPAQAVKKADSLSLSVAAASIMAKTERDKMMCELAKDYPGYGWEKNAGYGTKQHQDALVHYGPTPHHRYSFKPIAKLASS